MMPFRILTLFVFLSLIGCRPAVDATATRPPTLEPAPATAGTTAAPAAPTLPPPSATAADVSPQPPAAVTQPVSLLPADAERIIASQAQDVIVALRGQDLAALARHIHPGQGVRLSPYPFVSEADIVFQAGEIVTAMDSGQPYRWGVYDGSGDPIELTFADYWDRFVYNHEFAQAEQISYNHPLGTGTMVDNSQAFYPGSIIVEYHFPGFDPQYGGMDWQSLRLVFQPEGEAWYLVGIIHAQWTI